MESGGDHTDPWGGGGGAVPAQAEIVVALDFDDEPHTRTVPFPDDAPWLRFDPAIDIWTQDAVMEAQLTIDQPASSGVLWKNETPGTWVPDW